MAGIGSLYNSRGVLVGQAAAFVAPENTPLPGDSITLWDEAVWLAYTVQIGTPSAGNWTLTLTGGNLAAPLTTANIPFGTVNPATVAAAIQTALTAAGVTNVIAAVTGTGAVATPFIVSLSGPATRDIIITATFTLTGGTPLLTAPLWIPAGATEQGWQINYNPSVQDINIEEQQTAVDQQVTAAVLSFVANLAESTVQSMQWALAATKTVQAPDSTHFGKTTLALQASLPHYAVCVESKNKFGLPRRHYCPRMTSAANAGMNFRRAASSQMVPVTFTSISNQDEIQIVEITANHS